MAPEGGDNVDDREALVRATVATLDGSGRIRDDWGSIAGRTLTQFDVTHSLSTVVYRGSRLQWQPLHRERSWQGQSHRERPLAAVRPGSDRPTARPCRRPSRPRVSSR